MVKSDYLSLTALATEGLLHCAQNSALAVRFRVVPAVQQAVLELAARAGADQREGRICPLIARAARRPCWQESDAGGQNVARIGSWRRRRGSRATRHVRAVRKW